MATKRRLPIAPSGPATKSGKAAALSPKQQRFVAEYLVDLNATQAAIRAGYSAKTASSIGQENLTKPEIAAAVAAGQATVARKLGISAERVVDEAWQIVIADPRELVEHHIGSCRHCWGCGFKFQRTAAEMERDRGAHDRAVAKAAQDSRPEPAAFDEQGGMGFNAHREPNPECPECFGDGVGRTRINDTRRLSPSAAALYAGVKQTRDGFEVRMHDKLGAAEKLFRHLDLYDAVKAPAAAIEKLRAGVDGPLPDQARSLLAAGLSGELSLTQVSQLLSGLGTLAKLIETTELEARIAALELRQRS